MSKVHFAAELSSNHNGDFHRLVKLIHAAKDCGADSVKLQLFRVDKLYTSSIAAERQHLRAYEIPLDWLPLTKSECDKLGLSLGITPCYLDAVTEAAPYVDYFKIASYDAVWKPFVAACTATAKPLVISTGLLTNREIWYLLTGILWPDGRLVGSMRSYPLTLLHTVAAYPTPVAKCNLSRIAFLGDEMHRCASQNKLSQVGYSDHSVDARVVKRAVQHWGAQWVEFHLDLPDGKGVEALHSWVPGPIRNVIDELRMDAAYESWDCEERKWMRGVDGLRPTEEIR